MANLETSYSRYSKEQAAAEAAAIQNEPALSALIHPLDTPVPLIVPQSRHK
jgi:hypothetical protein